MSGRDQAATLRLLSPSGGGSVIPLSPPSRRRVVAVTGGKGGVGKSMTALNLAATWARRGAKTLAVDGDFGMADLNLLLGLAPERSLLDLLAGTPADQVVLQAHGVHLLPALNGSFTLANLDAPTRDRLLATVDALGASYDALVIDTPAGIGDSAMVLAGAAAEVVVVATPEPLSLADAYACLKVLATRQGVERAFLMPNAVRSPSESEEIVARLRALCDRFLGIEVTPLPAVPYDPAVPQAAAAGVPLVIHNPNCPAARAIARAAARIDALSGDAIPPGAGWLRRGAAERGL